MKPDAISQAFYQFFSSPGSIATLNVNSWTGILQFLTLLHRGKTWTKPNNRDMGKPAIVCPNKQMSGLERPWEHGLWSSYFPDVNSEVQRREATFRLTEWRKLAAALTQTRPDCKPGFAEWFASGKLNSQNLNFFLQVSNGAVSFYTIGLL